MTNAYNVRQVSYEKVHGITDSDVSRFVASISPLSGEKILDACCGYGAVSKALLAACKKQGIEVKLTLLDSAEAQLDRARQNLKGEQVEFVQADACNTSYPDNHFDVIACKMGLHEVNAVEQERMLQEYYRILKPGGRLVLWELALDKNTQPAFSKVVKEKDRIAGFTSLQENRHLPTEEETLRHLGKLGFWQARVAHKMQFPFNIKDRGSEMAAQALKNAGQTNSPAQEEEIKAGKVSLLKGFVERLNGEERQALHYNSKEEGSLWVTQAVFQAQKPIRFLGAAK